jgi:hypothetical protein
MLEEGAMRRIMEWNQARTLVLGLGVAVALPAAAAAHHQPGHQGGPDPAGNLSIDVNEPVTWGRSAIVTGKLTATNPNSGVAVDLEADPYPFEDSGFSRVASGTTDANGDYRLLDKPTLHTRYRAVAKTSPPTTSAASTVRVRIRVKFGVSTTRPRAGSLVRFSGTACPEHDGKLAYIQRRSSTGAYRTVARARLTDASEPCSEYARRIRVRSGGVYRVKVPSRDAEHSTGTSRRIRVSAR